MENKTKNTIKKDTNENTTPKKQKHLSIEEFVEISQGLEEFHAVFTKLWNLGKPIFTYDLPTAAITFDRDGNQLNFLFNPEFWDSITPYERNFVICHECLHALLNHGIRLKTLNPQLGNIAADVVINEMLLSGFGFSKEKLPWLSKNGCWYDSIQKECDFKIEEERSLEYYYGILRDKISEKLLEALKNGTLKIVDSHDGFNTLDSKDLSKILQDTIKSMNKPETETLNNKINDGNKCETAGTVAGDVEKIVQIGWVPKKKKWETVIKKWAYNYLKLSEHEREQWVKQNRRFTCIKTEKLLLPSDVEVEDTYNEKKRIKVVFFQDTSGSCEHLAERFFKAAKTLPSNRFNVELYCFDTKVYKTSLDTGKLYGFGGTSYSVLEEYVWNNIAKQDISLYPKAIFVITDSYGDNITPKKPENWHWFLSEKNSGCIPNTCNIYNLTDFE